MTAISTTPYGQFLTDLGSGVHNLLTDTHKVCLLTENYYPDFANHLNYAFVQPDEIAASTGGYTAGGETLTNKHFGYNTTTKIAQLTCDPITWGNLAADVRSAVVYRDSSNPNDQLLIGYIDFGIIRSYSYEAFKLSFTNGVITLSA